MAESEPHADPTAPDEPVPGHTAHGAAGEGGHGDDHHDAAHLDEAPLGPLDAAAWGATLLGIAVGLLVALLFYVATLNVPV